MTKPSPQLAIRVAAIAFGAGIMAGGMLAFAQTAPLFTLSISPQAPQAGDLVTVTAVPLNFTASSTTFTWYRSGTRLDAVSGLGRSALTINTDPARSETIAVRVVADPVGQYDSGERSAVITTSFDSATQQGPASPNNAQLRETIEDLTSGFSLEASERNPNPGGTVVVQVATFAFDKQNATYRWYVNGALQKELSGRGQSHIALPAGAEGETKIVRVDVTTPSGVNRSKSITVRTLSADLYWWTDTAVPYWYKGKALPSLNSRVTVAALPNAANAGQLDYRWEFNASTLPQSSGVGRQTFSFPITLAVEERVDVTMKDAAGSFSKTASLRIKPFQPSVGIYEVRPLRGIAYERRLAAFGAPSGEPYDFIAAPFFFPRGEERRLTYTWNLNSKDIVGEPPDPWRFILTSNPNTPSLDRLSVNAQDRSRPSQRVSAGITIELR